MQSFLELARARYSCRSFDSKPVENEKITKILQAGQLAPTCVNRQPWHAWVIQGEKALSRAYEATRFNFDAPLIIELWEQSPEAVGCVVVMSMILWM